MSNGLYNGLDNGLTKGEFNGQRNGLENGMFENETVIKKEVIQEGLQLYLDFSNPRCYNYGQGEIGNPIYNLIKGGGKNLSVQNLTGRTVPNAPYVDYAPFAHWNNYTLNGINQSYLASPNNTDFDIGTSGGFTVSMWIKVVATAPDYSVIFGKTIAGFVDNRYQVYTLANGVFGFLIQIGNATLIETPQNTFTIGKWCYLTATYIRDYGIRLYVNNVLLASGTTIPKVNNLTINANYRIGTHSGNINASGARFEMNYYTHYNRELSRDELTYNYNTTKQFMKL